MTDEAPAAHEQLYNMFLIGLMWLRHARPQGLVQRGSSVISAFVNASLLPPEAKALYEQGYELVEFTYAQSDVIIDNREPSRQRLAELIETSEKHLVILAVSDSPTFDYDQCFRPQGYRYVITTRGIAYATSVAPYYAELIDYERFIKGWLSHAAQMRGMHARRKEYGGDNFE